MVTQPEHKITTKRSWQPAWSSRSEPSLPGFGVALATLSPLKSTLNALQEQVAMDDPAFDRLARAAGTSSSRRRVFGVGAALPLAGLLAALVPENGVARRQHGRNRGHRPGKRKDNRKGQQGNPSNPGGGLGATACLGPTTNLQVVVEQAQAGDTLTLCAGTFPEQVLDIDKHLTITGAGSSQTILPLGRAVDPYLRVAGGATVTLQGLTFAGWGNPRTRVPAVFNEGSLTLADVVIRDSLVNYLIRNFGTLNLTQGSTITGNTCEGDGSALYNEGTLYLTGGAAITGNASEAQGTAIYNAKEGQVTIDAGCQVTGNSSSLEDGYGGIYSTSSELMSIADRTIVRGNQTFNCGPAHYDNCLL